MTTRPIKVSLGALATCLLCLGLPSAPWAAPSSPTPIQPAPLSIPTPADLTRGMEVSEGLLSFHRAEDKAYAVIARSYLDKPLWVSANLRRGLGASTIYPNTMGPSWIARFHLGPNKMLQLIADNPKPFAAVPTPAYAKLAEASYAPSLLGSWPIKAIDSSSVAIDGSALALSDLGAWPARLEAALKIGYTLDAANSHIECIHNSPTETIVSTEATYAIAKLPAGAATPPLPDARSAMLSTVLSFTALPEVPMPTRLVHESVGFFQANRKDLTPAARPHQQRQSFIARWRLDRADPGSIDGPVKTPIRFEICPEMPERYRGAVREGISRWIPAFDKIGMRGAIEIKQLDDDQSIAAGGLKATVCFLSADDASTAYGPAKIDPRTGEIREARVMIPEIFATGARFDFASRKPILTGFESHTAEALNPATFGSDDALANPDWIAQSLAEEWSDERKEAYAQSQIAAVVAHEIGHALGLRHNFKGSTAYSFSQISAPGYQGPLTSSVMDYLPTNVYSGRDPASTTAFPQSIGVYDEWAIAYAYSAFPDEASEKAGLTRILAQAQSDPRLALGSDEEAQGPNAIDPKSAAFDLSSDPIAFAQSRFALAQDTIDRMALRARAGTLDPFAASQALPNILHSTSRYAAIVARYFGGANLTRQEGGSRTPSLSSIDPAEQRRAMAFLTQTILGHYLDAPPELLARAVGPSSERGQGNPSFDWENKVGDIQAKAIAPFFTPILTDRIMDSSRWGQKTKSPGPMDLREVEISLMRSVWAEAWQSTPIARTRRELQRSYLDFLVMAIKTPGNLSADPRALFREIAKDIEARARKEAHSPTRSLDERAHLQEVARALGMALRPGAVSWGADANH